MKERLIGREQGGDGAKETIETKLVTVVKTTLFFRRASTVLLKPLKQFVCYQTSFK